MNNTIAYYYQNNWEAAKPINIQVSAAIQNRNLPTHEIVPPFVVFYVNFLHEKQNN